jgi:cell filamentation protein
MDEEKNKIKLFEEKHVRAVWDDDAEKWWFSVVDICAILTDSDYQVARNHWKWLKNKLNAEGSELVSDTNRLKM